MADVLACLGGLGFLGLCLVAVAFIECRHDDDVARLEDQILDMADDLLEAKRALAVAVKHPSARSLASVSYLPKFQGFGDGAA
jgi:hypothetical protein